MENKNEILNELQSISPVIAAISRVNVFTVPEGYFDSIADTVMITVAEDSLLPLIPSHFKETDVPQGYFDSLPALIMDKIRGQEEVLPTVFSSINKEERLFTLPANYFDNLSDEVLNRIKGEPEEVQLSPALAGLKKSNPFYIPGNYFEELTGEILKKINQPADGKVISMPKRTSVFKYAAAAVITGALALGVYKFSNQTGNPATSTTFASLDPSIEKGKLMDDKNF